MSSASTSGGVGLGLADLPGRDNFPSWDCIGGGVDDDGGGGENETDAQKTRDILDENGDLDFSIDTLSELNASLLDREEAKILSRGVSEAIKSTLSVDDSASHSVLKAKGSSSSENSYAKSAVARTPTTERRRPMGTPSPVFGKDPIRHLETPAIAKAAAKSAAAFDAAGTFDGKKKRESVDSDASLTMAELHELHARESASGAPYFISDDENGGGAPWTPPRGAGNANDSLPIMGESPILPPFASPAPSAILKRAHGSALKTPGLSPIVSSPSVGAGDASGDRNEYFQDADTSCEDGSKLCRSLSLEFDSAHQSENDSRRGDHETPTMKTKTNEAAHVDKSGSALELLSPLVMDATPS